MVDQISGVPPGVGVMLGRVGVGPVVRVAAGVAVGPVVRVGAGVDVGPGQDVFTFG